MKKLNAAAQKQLAENLKALPERAAIVSGGFTVILKRGEEGFYNAPAGTNADQINKALGVTNAQAEAMLCGSMFGFHVLGANPDTYKNLIK